MAKFFQNFKILSRKIIEHLLLSSQLPGGLLYVNFMNQPQNVDFGRDIPGLFCRFQKRSKMTKSAKKLQKWLFSADLSVLSKNFSKNLPTDQFSSHSDQKKSLFGKIENFLDFTVENGPNPKSGPFWPNLVKKTWSNGLFICEKLFSTGFRLLGIFGRKPYPNSEKN